MCAGFCPLAALSIPKAWSHIVHTLIPNAAVLHRHLSIFAKACNATEVILFERATFLVIATSSSPSPHTLGTVPPVVDAKAGGLDPDSITSHRLDPTRYERTSELIKAFKYCCSRVRGEFHTLEMELHDFSAVLDEMTRNTYVMVIVHDPTIGKFVPGLALKRSHAPFFQKRPLSNSISGSHAASSKSSKATA